MMKMKALGLSLATVASFGLLVNLPVQAATDLDCLDSATLWTS